MDADILTDPFVHKISKKINPTQCTADDLSLMLGFSQAEGGCAAITGNVVMNPRKALQDLLFKFVMKHGRSSQSALMLRKIFLDNEMKDVAIVIERELKTLNIHVPSDVETVVDAPVSLPSPPSGTPGEEAEAFSTKEKAKKEPVKA